MSLVDRKRAIKPAALKDLDAQFAEKKMKKAVPSPRVGTSPKARTSMGDVKARAAAPGTPRRKSVGGSLDADAEEVVEEEGPSTATNANHNKYCHFCQHVKVRASSMLACENKECCRRFCEHCLLTHLGETVEPMSSDAWQMTNGKAVWNCPICRNKCCCSVADCGAEHRHCKAYRYRRRRAEQASKRMAAVADKRGVKKAAPAAGLSQKKMAASSRPTVALNTGSAIQRMTHMASEIIETPPPSFNSAAPKGHHEPWGLECSPASHPSEYAAPGSVGARRHVLRRDLSPVDSVVSGDAPREAGPQHDGASISSDVWASRDDRSAFFADSSAHAHKEAGNYWESQEVVESMQGGAEGVFEDEALGVMYGHMHACSYIPEQEDDGSDLDVLSTNGVWAMHEPQHDVESQRRTVHDLDEATWLRRTYETVYNPAARQRALQALVSGCPSSGKREVAGLFADESARKCTVVYDYA